MGTLSHFLALLSRGSCAEAEGGKVKGARHGRRPLRLLCVQFGAHGVESCVFTPQPILSGLKAR
jgi:hypothetical protein